MQEIVIMYHQTYPIQLKFKPNNEKGYVKHVGTSTVTICFDKGCCRHLNRLQYLQHS